MCRTIFSVDFRLRGTGNVYRMQQDIGSPHSVGNVRMEELILELLCSSCGPVPLYTVH
jgi:hypothetical protein